MAVARHGVAINLFTPCPARESPWLWTRVTSSGHVTRDHLRMGLPVPVSQLLYSHDPAKNKWHQGFILKISKQHKTKTLKWKTHILLLNVVKGSANLQLKFPLWILAVRQWSNGCSRDPEAAAEAGEGWAGIGPLSSHNGWDNGRWAGLYPPPCEPLRPAEAGLCPRLWGTMRWPILRLVPG